MAYDKEWQRVREGLSSNHLSSDETADKAEVKYRLFSTSKNYSGSHFSVNTIFKQITPYFVFIDASRNMSDSSQQLCFINYYLTFFFGCLDFNLLSVKQGV